MTQVIKKERLGMVINPKDVRELDLIASEQEVSRSFLIRQAIKKLLEENAKGKKKNKTKE